MVLGKQSQFIEGFKTISIDDDVLLDNIKNAINLSIEGDKNTSGIGASSKLNRNKMPIPVPTSGNSSEPMPTTTLGLTNNDEETEEMPEPTPTPTPTKTLSTSKKGKITKSPFFDIKNRVETQNNKTNEIISGKVIGEMEEEEPVNKFEEENPEIMNKKKHTRNIELRKQQNNNDLTDDEEEEDIEEGFSGSQILEAKSIKNLLLALLIAFIGYVIAMSSTKNLLPITEISPDLKRFKNLIYVGLFFIIIYLCLEIF